MDLWQTDYMRHQSLYRTLTDRLSVVAALLGGSQLYGTLDDHGPQEISDWDGALFVTKKIDIMALVNNYRQLLMDLLGISYEEYPRLCVPLPSDPGWDNFDAVRFAGFTKTGAKKSVKILSLEHFMGSNRSLNILSYKDKRVFDAYTVQNKPYFRIQLATRLKDGVCILHDHWVFRARTSSCVHGNNISRTAFGVTADLLMTGAWLFGEAHCGRMVQEKLLQAFREVSGQHARLENSARNSRFSHKHRDWLTNRLAQLNATVPTTDCCGCHEADDLFLYETSSDELSSTLPLTRHRIWCLPPELCTSGEIRKITHVSQDSPSIFSSNSINYLAEISPGFANGSATKVFCKQSQSQEQEAWGAKQAALYYPSV